ncbi:MAG TPA: PfkB family carbohydrate kinase [Desulfomonilia bacterium]
MKYDVAAVGTLNLDMIISGNAPHDIEALTRWVDISEVELTPAGSMGYCASDMAKLGLKVGVISCVADDFFGEWILKSLTKAGADVSHVDVITGGKSGIGIYILLFGDRKRPLTGRLSTHAPWPARLTGAQENLLRHSRMLLCAGYLHYPQMWGTPTVELFRKARQFGLKTALDTQFPMTQAELPWIKHFDNLLDYVDILFTDDVEALSITGLDSIEAAASDLLARGPELVVVKKGAEGSLIATANKVLNVPAIKPASFQDSIGAGDAFDAGFIYGVLKGWELEKTARFASTVAACTLEGIGGTKTAPSAAQAASIAGISLKP